MRASPVQIPGWLLDLPRCERWSTEAKEITGSAYQQRCRSSTPLLPTIRFALLPVPCRELALQKLVRQGANSLGRLLHCSDLSRMRRGAESEAFCLRALQAECYRIMRQLVRQGGTMPPC